MLKFTLIIAGLIFLQAFAPVPRNVAKTNDQNDNQSTQHRSNAEDTSQSAFPAHPEPHPAQTKDTLPQHENYNQQPAVNVSVSAKTGFVDWVVAFTSIGLLAAAVWGVYIAKVTFEEIGRQATETAKAAAASKEAAQATRQNVELLMAKERPYIRIEPSASIKAFSEPSGNPSWQLRITTQISVIGNTHAEIDSTRIEVRLWDNTLTGECQKFGEYAYRMLPLIMLPRETPESLICNILNRNVKLCSPRLFNKEEWDSLFNEVEGEPRIWLHGEIYYRGVFGKFYVRRFSFVWWFGVHLMLDGIRVDPPIEIGTWLKIGNTDCNCDYEIPETIIT